MSEPEMVHCFPGSVDDDGEHFAWRVSALRRDLPDPRCVLCQTGRCWQYVNRNDKHDMSWVIHAVLPREAA